MSIRPFSATRRQLLLVHLTSIGVFLDDLGAEIQEDFVDICSSSCRCLVVWLLTPLLGKLEGSGSGHHAVVFHVRFVADHDQRDVLVVLDADDLFPEFGQFVERVHVADGEDKQETLALLHVQFTHGRELFRAGRVETGMVSGRVFLVGFFGVGEEEGEGVNSNTFLA